MKKVWLIVLGVVVVLALYGFGVYNGLITSREAADSQWAQVETQYQRRYDLIPNLVEAVKGVMKQETAVFTALAEARTRYAGAATVNDKAAATTQVDSALGRLLAIVENYPQLKSSENVQTLMSQIEGTENRISVERKRYNDQVQSYNLKVKTFPSSIIAGLTGFTERTYYQSVAGSETAPQVKF